MAKKKVQRKTKRKAKRTAPHIVGKFATGATAAELREVGSLTPDSDNVRLHDDRNIDSIKSSLNAFGQQTPIVCKADSVVIKGNGMLTAAIALGWTHVAVTQTDLEGDEARAYAIADNRTSDLSVFSVDNLVTQLQDLGELAGAAGYSEEELAAVAAGLAQPTDADWSNILDAHVDAELEATKSVTFVMTPKTHEKLDKILRRLGGTKNEAFTKWVLNS